MCNKMDTKKKLCLLLNVVVASCAREPSSPICSKYDYEERLLEKDLRNGLALETTLSEIMKTNSKVVNALKQIEDGKAKIESKLAIIKKKHKDMESRLSDFINNASNNMNSTLAANVGIMVKAVSDMKANFTVTAQQLVNQVHILKDKLKVPTISFRSRITTSPIDLSSDHDVVDVNEGYDNATGKFTAAVPGMYQFSVQYCVNSKENVHLEVVHKGKILQRSTCFDQHGLYPCVTMQVSSSVAMGDHSGCAQLNRVRCTQIQTNILHSLAH